MAPTTTSAPIVGNTYYVGKNGHNTSGTTGSSNDPFLTVAYAASRIRSAGDTIHIGEGTFDEVGEIDIAAGVDLIGEGPTKTIITSTTLTGNYNGGARPLLRLHSESLTNGNQTIMGIAFDGHNCSVYGGVSIHNRHNVEVTGCDFDDFNLYGLLIHGNNGSGLASGCHVSYCNITNCSGYDTQGYYVGALTISCLTDFELDHCSLIENGKNTSTQGWPIKAWWFQGGHVNNSSIHDNYIEKTLVSGGDGYGSGYTITVETDDCQDLEIYNNEILGSIDINNSTTGTSYGTYVHDNVIGYPDNRVSTDALQPVAFILELGLEDVLIEHNEIRNTGGVIACFPRRTGIDNVVFRYNLCRNIRSGQYGTAIFMQEAGWNPDNNSWGVLEIQTLEIYNNTIVNSSSDQCNYGLQIARGSSSGGFNINGFVLANNIIQGFPTYWFAWESCRNGSNVRVSNNLLYDNGGSNAMTGSLPANSIYQNNIIGNPLFVSSSNFTLQQNSPAVNAGYTVVSGLTDLNGVSVPQGNGVDIGCYERIVGSGTTTVAPTTTLAPITTTAAPTTTLAPVTTTVAPTTTVTPSGGRLNYNTLNNFILG